MRAIWCSADPSCRFLGRAGADRQNWAATHRVVNYLALGRERVPQTVYPNLYGRGLRWSPKALTTMGLELLSTEMLVAADEICASKLVRSGGVCFAQYNAGLAR